MTLPRLAFPGEGAVRRYRTEIVIPEDRFITIQLPPDVPTGRAKVSIQVEDAAPADDPEGTTADDHDDIEWWDEFGEAPEGDEPWGLTVRLSTLES